MIPRFLEQHSDAGSLSLRALGAILVEGSTEFVAELQPLVSLLRAELVGFGLTLPVDGAPADVPTLRLAQEPGLDDEGYRLEVSEAGVRLLASGARGIFYGTRSLVVALGSSGELPHGRVFDAPRYPWRGVHLDVARHFFPVDFVKRFVDLLALHKLNVFHWHLTEDQGWRISIDAFPRLTEVAAFREQEGGRYGGFYTKDEVREVVRYAAERFVTVIPEIEMPGHALAALAAYPELSCSGGPFEVETRWGIFEDVYCLGNDRTLEFLERVVDEVCELFPSEYFHIGGDECPKVRWRACPRCRERMRAEGLADENALQSWFVGRMSRYLERRGKRLVGWDEILEGGLAPGATVMSWRGTEGGVRAAQMGHDVVMSPTTHCYLDYKQQATDEEPGAWFAPALELATVYGYEPTPAELTPEQARHVLGVQANVWTERMPTPQHVEYMVFPRLCAVAEVAWSDARRDFEGFLERWETHRALLDHFQVAYRGSGCPAPRGPSAEEQAQYRRAVAERSRGEATLAYTTANA